jgi:hypothetical protein
VFKAIHYLLERNPVIFKDGVFIVNLEGVDSFWGLLFKFSTEMKLGHPSAPSKEDLINDLKT